MTHFEPRRSPTGQAYLNVGCGVLFHPHWTNIDLTSPDPLVTAYDITQGFPYADETFEVVYHSHILEHLPPEMGAHLMRECYRVLKRGGLLRVVLPDLEHGARVYLEALAAVQRKPSPLHQEHYEWARLNLIDQMLRTRSGGNMQPFLQRQSLLDLEYIVQNGGGENLTIHQEVSVAQPAPPPNGAGKTTLRRRIYKWLRYRWYKHVPFAQTMDIVRFRQQGEIHQWMYDAYSVTQLLTQIGFATPQALDAFTSQIPDWGTYQLDVNAQGQPRKTASLFFEAHKR